MTCMCTHVVNTNNVVSCNLSIRLCCCRGPGVDGRQVDVTGDVVPEPQEGLLAQCLGHDVGQLVVGGHLDDGNRSFM